MFFQIDAGRLRDGSGAKLPGRKELPSLERLVERGLRARLELQSLVTGQMVVALNFYPATPVRLTGRSRHYPEIPTIPSSFDTLTRRLEGLPIEALVAEATRMMQSVEKLMSAPEVTSAVSRLDRVLSDVETLVRRVDVQIDPLVRTVQTTAVATQTTMVEAQTTLSDVRAVLGQLAPPAAEAIVAAQSAMTEAQRTMAEMRTAVAQLTPPATAAIADYQKLAQDSRNLVAHADAQIEAVAGALQATLAEVHGVLGDDSPVRYDLANALQEMTKAARSLRTLAEYLDRHPEALLVGKRAETAR